jgi:hypothetical protein
VAPFIGREGREAEARVAGGGKLRSFVEDQAMARDQFIRWLDRLVLPWLQSFFVDDLSDAV